MSLVLDILLMVVSLINVVIHSLGSYVLYKLSKHSSDTIINQIFILSLSLSEIFICFIFFISMVIGVTVTPMEMSPALNARNYMMIFCDTGEWLFKTLNQTILFGLDQAFLVFDLSKARQWYGIFTIKEAFSGKCPTIYRICFSLNFWLKDFWQFRDRSIFMGIRDRENCNGTTGYFGPSAGRGHWLF